MQHIYFFTVLALDEIFFKLQNDCMGFFSAQNHIFRNNPENFHLNSDNFCKILSGMKQSTFI